MLSFLTITTGKTVRAYPALELLGFLQQALPGREKPSGTGTLADPWTPASTKQWWFVSKEKPTEVKVKQTAAWGKSVPDKTVRTVERFGAGSKAWLSVGGQWISIQADNFYASAYGLHPALPITGAVTEPAAVFTDTAYSDIYIEMLGQSSGTINDAATARKMRSYLKGTATAGNNDVLPLLTSVLFVSEVARNHTAFHSGLMALDLIEAGTSVSGASSFKYDFKNVLWEPQIIDSILKIDAMKNDIEWLKNEKASANAYLDQLNSQRDSRGRMSNTDFRNFNATKSDLSKINADLNADYAAKESAHNTIQTASVGMDDRDNPHLPSKGGESQFKGGVAPMSHTGSAYGAAYDLEKEGNYKGVSGTGTFSKPSSALTMVRRKEATILIRWLEAYLKKQGMTVSAVATEDVTEQKGLYAHLSQLAQQENGAGTTGLLQAIQKRVDSFDCLL